MIKSIYTYYSNKSLKTKILVICIIFAIVLFSFIFLLLYETYYKSSTDQIEIASNVLLESFTYKYSSFANEIGQLLNDMIKDKDIYKSLILLSDNRNNTELAEKVKNSLSSYIKKNIRINSIRIYIGDRLICVDSNGHIITEDKILTEKYYNKIVSYDGQVITVPSRPVVYQSNIVLNKKEDLTFKYTYNKSIVSFGKLVRNNENKKDLAIILIDFEENYISNIQRITNLTKSNFFVLTNSEGDVITSLAKQYLGKNIFNIINYDPNSSEILPNNFYLDINDEKYFVTHTKYWLYNWELFSFIPVNEILFNRSIFIGSIVILLLLLTVLVVVLTYILTRTITKPTYKIIGALEQLKYGNFSSRIIVEKNDEFGKISEMFNHMANNLQKLLKENYETALKEKEAQIKFLQSQINPHFLYNALETIKWKILSRENNVDKLLTGLGQILRYSFKNPNEVVTLKSDLKQVENYINIQMARYEGRFETYLKFEPQTLSLKIHKLLIQPIVENSIIHGLEQKEENGILCISTKVEGDSLLITIFDNGCGIKEGNINQIYSVGNSSIGINNVNKRIQYYYGPDYGLKIYSKINKYTKVIIKLPKIM